MDFASLMSKELAKAKPEKSKKYVKKAELEAERVAAYKAEQAAAAQARAEKENAKRKFEEEEAEEKRLREEKRQRLAEQSRQAREEREAEEEAARRKRLGLPELKKVDDAEAESRKAQEDGVDDVAEEELAPRLRELGHPVRLFGESHWQRVRRYHRLATVVTDGPIPTTLQPVEEKDMRLDGSVPQDKAGRKYLFRQLASYFSMVLVEYQRAMERERVDTSASRAAYNTMERCREDMKPLFRKFEKDDIEDSVLEPIVEIVKAAQERRYVDANDGYLRLSIGKAAWPIGVTMVGIHERSAREKLHNGEKGHVMGDEVTRKYLQSIKRYQPRIVLLGEQTQEQGRGEHGELSKKRLNYEPAVWGLLTAHRPFAFLSLSRLIHVRPDTAALASMYHQDKPDSSQALTRLQTRGNEDTRMRGAAAGGEEGGADPLPLLYALGGRSLPRRTLQKGCPRACSFDASRDFDYIPDLLILVLILILYEY
ncbi:Pre-mRNA-splicing factor 18 [Ceratocystis lukuohia]|uniref:Pre-mRNA-splicing factor 18 n=1 Tax=Ceratocystis lukuohia TaxID=2019550 RepID=A0ABR4MBE7_9PEZI